MLHRQRILGHSPGNETQVSPWLTLATYIQQVIFITIEGMQTRLANGESLRHTFPFAASSLACADPTRLLLSFAKFASSRFSSCMGIYPASNWPCQVVMAFRGSSDGVQCDLLHSSSTTP